MFRNNIINTIFTLVTLTMLSGCGGSGEGFLPDEAVLVDSSDPYRAAVIEIPTLIVIMNWNNYSEQDALKWYNKFFMMSDNSVNEWYDKSINGEIKLVPVLEKSGTENDGIIMVDMDADHPGDSDIEFRDTYITQAIEDFEVTNNVAFNDYDTDGDKNINYQEMQIIFIVAGGETAYGDPSGSSIWAHAWSFDEESTLGDDDVTLMKYTGDDATSGSYARFGANHGGHTATIGIIIHELGHSLMNLGDYYDNGGGAGLGYYDIMSGGSWAKKLTDDYSGDTPTQFSAFNKIDANLDVNVTVIDASQNITLRCSSRESAKLLATKVNEYFILECRDTAKGESDNSFNEVDNKFTDNRLFATLYHVDENKDDNTQSGLQTSSNHYKVALVEKDTSSLLTSSETADANINDVYLVGDIIQSSRTKFYDGSSSGYSVEITGRNDSARTLSMRITKQE